MRMNKNQFVKRMAVAAGFFFLCATSGLTRAQSGPSSPAPAPHKPLPAPRPKNDTTQTAEFAGLTFTDEQKARIDQIHQNMKLRMDAVVKNETLTAEQRNAMIEGYRRSERSQVFRVLTSAQQKAVLERARAQRATEEQKQQSPPN